MYTTVVFPTNISGTIVTDNPDVVAAGDNELTWVKSRLDALGFPWTHQYYWPGEGCYYVDIETTEQELRAKIQTITDALGNDDCISIHLSIDKTRIVDVDSSEQQIRTIVVLELLR